VRRSLLLGVVLRGTAKFGEMAVETVELSVVLWLENL
jgi:hypothetical protein